MGKFFKKFYGSDCLKYSFDVKTVGDGIEICTAKGQGFKTACISLNFTLPLGEKASLFALVPGILTRSTQKYPSVKLLERKSASLYGADIVADVSKTGENQVIKLAVSCIDDRFALENESITQEAAKLLFEIAFRPDFENGFFKKDEVESEKRLLLEQLGAEKSDKRIYAKNRCEEIMFADELYGINRLGNSESVSAIDEKSLTKAYFEMLSTSHITLSLSGGDLDTGKIEKLFFDYLPELEREKASLETLFVESAEDVTYIKETENIKQGKLVLGFRLGMQNAYDGYAARRVMTDLFGGSPHSKLFSVVREKMSLCYYCSARMYMRKGIMLVQSGIESQNEEKAREGILAQLEALKNGDFSQEELEASQKALEDAFKGVSDSPEALDAWFMTQSASGEYKFPEEYIEDFKAVTAEDVINAAKAVTLDTVFMLSGEGGEEE